MPTITYPVWETTASNHCGGSSFTYFGDKDKMWENSTALADHFFVLATNGSCQFALKRLDGLDNTILLGDLDMTDVLRSSIASSRDSPAFETVEGQMNCGSDAGSDGEVNFERTLRDPGSTN
ncbi:hypothetical protein UCDDA912_g09452 [Diaporthe ampelina]|uniref:Uncharacterized protein n=1 Tax=Diaporthe ampelina TaxID=1214573 RepID=A0A0G2F8R3_9PEZI|nr:hypothetical protein UCDDA912_g09452 [Diaporthe ampelina]